MPHPALAEEDSGAGGELAATLRRLGRWQLGPTGPVDQLSTVNTADVASTATDKWVPHVSNLISG